MATHVSLSRNPDGLLLLFTGDSNNTDRDDLWNGISPLCSRWLASPFRADVVFCSFCTTLVFYDVLCFVFPFTLLAGDAESSGVIWVVFLMLTFLHIYANVRAACALQLTTLNRSRMDVLLQNCSACKVARVPHGLRNSDCFRLCSRELHADGSRGTVCCVPAGKLHRH